MGPSGYVLRINLSHNAINTIISLISWCGKVNHLKLYGNGTFTRKLREITAFFRVKS